MSRVQVGQRFGRYEVVRYAAPTQDGGGRMRSSVMVRCVCGTEAVVQERRLKAGESAGCSSKRCYHQNHHSDAIEPLLVEAMSQVFERYRTGGAEAVAEWLRTKSAEVCGG